MVKRYNHWKYNHWKLEKDGDDILWCHLDKSNSSTNILSAEVLKEFGDIIEAIEKELPRGLIILSDKDNGFIAGADVLEFTKLDGKDEALDVIQNVHGLFNSLEKLSCQTLCLINGFCLGGGLELALACRYRIALDGPGTRLGLPEVLLGIHPGFGGTVRFIRVSGVMQAMPLMLAGRNLDAREAKKLGLVDRVVPERQFKNAARSLILNRPPQKLPGALNKLVNVSFVRTILAKIFRHQLEKRVKQQHYPAPFALVDLWRKYGGSKKRMLEQEAKSVADLITSETSKNLVRVFLLQEQLKSIGNEQDFKPKRIHVIGAGVMGGDIATWCVFKGYQVTLQDRAPEFIAPVIKRAYSLFKKRLKLPYRITAAMDSLAPDISGRGIEKADIIIEAIVENTEAKVALFKEIEARASADALLATNTSSIRLDDISKHLRDPKRLVGIHFFNPVAKMQLVEVVHSQNTAQDWINKASVFCRKIDRLPLLVKSSPGFLVNRILTPYLLVAVELFEEGIPVSTIDKVAEDFGMPMGPVKLADTVGLDICLSVASNMAKAIDVKIPVKLQQMVDAGNLGKKTGKGFYEYKKGKAMKPASGAYDVDLTVLEDRLILRILNESVACLREQVVADADSLDAGMIFGTGFAPFRGGPMHYAKNRGYSELVNRLIELQLVYGDKYTPDHGWKLLTGEDD